MAEIKQTQFVSTDPEHISISKSKGIKIDWKDGHTSEYGLRYLRHHCPCAVCSGSHGTEPQAPPLEPETSPFPFYTPALKMVIVEPGGNYATRTFQSGGRGRG